MLLSRRDMKNIHYNKAGYAVWNDTGKFVSRSRAKPRKNQKILRKGGNLKVFRKSRGVSMSPDIQRKLKARR